MKRGKSYYIGISLIIIGVAIFIFYYATGRILFYGFDEVTQVNDIKIISYDDYLSNALYEGILFILSILSFFSGVVMLFINSMKSTKE